MKALVLSVLLLSAAPPPYQPATLADDILPEIAWAGMLGTDVLILHSDMTSTLISLTDVALVEPVVINRFGYPAVRMLAGSLGAPSNGSLETTYISRFGEHTIRTSCWNFSEIVCAKKHLKQLLAMQSIAPRI